MKKSVGLVSYLIKKVITLVRVRRLRNREYKPGIVVLGKIAQDKKQRIVFYLNNSEFVHPGDHLFFEPALRWLAQSHDDVYINPTTLMTPYFQENGYRISKSIQNDDLVITRPELLNEIKKQCGNIICFDTTCSRIDMPIINYFIQALTLLFNLVPTKDFDYCPSSMKTETALDLTRFQHGNFVLFNNYISSGRFRVGEKKRRQLREFTKQFKQRSRCKIIHVGSSDDLMQDDQVYDFVDIDLRGKTSISDLFCLAQLPSISATISFDGFSMHLMALNSKPAYVLFRGRWTTKARHYILNYINPPFITKKKQITYID